MRTLWLLLISTLTFGCLTEQHSEEPTPEALLVLRDQVAAFNRHDINGLMKNIDTSFKWYGIANDTMMVEVDSPEAFRQSMVNYFDNYPTVKSQIEDSFVVGNQVCFRENVTWTTESGEKTQTALGVYQIIDGKIQRVWYFYAQ